MGIDTTIVNLALPSIQHSLRTSVTGLQWCLDAYTVVLGSALLLSGSIADRIGRKRTFAIGLAMFTMSSLLCGFASSVGYLILFRMLQAIGGSMLNPVAMSIIANVFDDRVARARAIGVWAGVSGISMASGPILGGLIIEVAGWRGVFWVNVPIGLLAIILTWRIIPESRSDQPRPLDPVGQVLSVLVLGTLIYGIIDGPKQGWCSAPILLCFGVTVVACVGLVSYERRHSKPLLEFRFFRSVSFSGAMAIALCALAATSGFLFLNTVFLQEVRGFSALSAGIIMLPFAVMATVAGPVSGRLVAMRDGRWPLMIGGIAMAAVSLFGLRLAIMTPLPLLVCAYGIFGLGFGLTTAPVNAVAVAGMPRERAGVAASMASIGRQVGQALGIAVVGTVLTSGLNGPVQVRFPSASRDDWWVLAGCGGVVFFLGVITTSTWAVRTVVE